MNMSILEIESRIIDLEQNIEKAKYLIENFIERYDLDSIEDMSEHDMRMFAVCRDNMYIEASIIHDYIHKAQTSVNVLREGVLV